MDSDLNVRGVDQPRVLRRQVASFSCLFGSFADSRKERKGSTVTYFLVVLPRMDKNMPSSSDQEGVDDVGVVSVHTAHKTVWTKTKCIKTAANTCEYSVPKHLFKGPTWSLRSTSVREVFPLYELKTELNYTKGLLDEMPLEQWHEHTRKMNTAGAVIHQVRDQFGPEYCSQAWCKMYEMLCKFDLVPLEVKGASAVREVSFFSVHLCEAPGAFISATNHYLRTNFPQIKWQWMATTLNPHYEGNDTGTMINEDKLINTSLENWTFLEDSTGDIMRKRNFESLVADVKKRQLEFGKTMRFPEGKTVKVRLVTADGSIDCQGNPTEQEATVARLQFTEIVAALSILGVGGNFVLKIFTFFECQTLGNLYLLCSLFEEVHLSKPATSKEGNSEVYVICLRFMGLRQRRFQWGIEEMTRVLVGGPEEHKWKKQSMIAFRLVALHPFFMKAILGAAKFFSEFQIAVIKRNIETFQKGDATESDYFLYEMLKNQVAEEWITKHAIKKLPRQFSLFKLQYHSGKLPHVDPRKEIGSYKDKLSLNSTNVFKKAMEIERQVRLSFASEMEMKSKGLWKVGKIMRIDNLKAITPDRGRPYKNTMSSRFCLGQLLQHRETLRKGLVPLISLISDRPCLACKPEVLIHQFITLHPTGVKGRLVGRPQQFVVESLCCNTPLKTMLEVCDYKITSDYLKSILLKMTEMKEGHSLFLCAFPLLSRIQVGFVYMLSTFFEQVLVCYGGTELEVPPGGALGILLHSFKGTADETEASLMVNLAYITKELEGIDATDERQSPGILSFVPLKTLIEAPFFNDILRYNLVLVSAEIQEAINNVKRSQSPFACSSGAARINAARRSIDFKDDDEETETNPDVGIRRVMCSSPKTVTLHGTESSENK